MGRISGLPDELLIKILSFLPTKIAVSTSILSKQWQFLWMWLPKLEYNHSNYSERQKLRCFLDRNMPLHRAPVLESFGLAICTYQFKPEDIKLWILSAVSRSLRELEIHCVNTWHSTCKLNILPSSLYTCKSLVTLKLTGQILVDVPRSMVCLPSLKDLRLRHVTYLNGDSLQRLLSNCPVLEDLSVVGCEGDTMGKLNVIVSSLLRLSLNILTNVDEFVINTPSLKYLKIRYDNRKNHHHCLIENMPMLEDANIYVSFRNVEQRVIRSVTSVKRLELFLRSSEVVYGVFNQLEHLKLSLCPKYSLSVLIRLLKETPNLQVLDLYQMDCHKDGGMFWKLPSTVPECLLSSLQTFRWSGYIGRPHERDVAIYILENARVLQTATILSRPCSVSSHDMLKELALCSRASNNCRLVFD